MIIAQSLGEDLKLLVPLLVFFTHKQLAFFKGTG